MKKIVILWCLLTGGCALRAETVWFNVLGDPSDPGVNTIEVDPTPISANADTRTMRIRVSRSAQRITRAACMSGSVANH